MVEQRVEHRRHQHGRGDPLLLDGLQDLRRVEPRQHVEGAALDHGRREERRAGVRQRRTHQEPRRLRPLPLGQLDLGHRGHRLRGADHALGLAGRPAGVGDRDDVVGRQQPGVERLRFVRRSLGDQVAALVGERLGHRSDGEHLLEPRALLQQGHGALGEHRVDDQGGDPGVVDDVGMVVGRAQRVQGGPPEALGLASAEDEQHLGAVQRQQRGVRARAGAKGLERLDVLTDARGRLAAGQRGVTEVHHRLVAVPLQCCHHQVAVVRRGAQVVCHGWQTRTCSSLRQRPRTHCWVEWRRLRQAGRHG